MINFISILKENKLLIEFFTALIPIAITILGSYIAIQQYRTNRKKLKLDLFEKRYAIYIAIVMFLSEVVRTIKIEKKQQINFIENTRGAEFLFDADIKKYIDQIWEKAVDLETWSYDHNTSEHSGKRAETMKWLIKQLDEIDQRFKKYMQLSH